MTKASGRIAGALLGLLVFLCASSAFAEDELSAGNTAWVMTSTALVLMMTLPGLALFYGGLVRSKNVLSILMQCLFAAALLGVLWVVAGYSLAFHGDGAFIGNLDKLMLAGIGAWAPIAYWMVVPPSA